MFVVPYAELHCHSAFSFLDGASLPEELVAAAVERGHEALALTDHDSLSGSMEFAQTAKSMGLRAIHGAEVTVVPGPPGSAPAHLAARTQTPAAAEAAGARHLTLLVRDARGWHSLCRLLTRAHAHTRDQLSRRMMGHPLATLEDVPEHAEGLVCLSGCARQGVRDERALRRLVRAFGRDGLRVELQRPFTRHDRALNRELAALGARLRVACVATGNVHAHSRERALVQDAFAAIREHTTLDASEPLRRGNHSHVLVSPQAMAARFADHPDAVEEAGRLAAELRFDLTSDLGYRYPGAEDETSDARLAEVCHARFADRYPSGHRLRAEAADRLEGELRLIAQLGLSGFFILHRDLLELAREVAVEVRGPDTVRALLPPGRGRGSSVSSIVCYLTGLSHIDPVENELFLGRFLNEELTALPDIDLDFPRDIREKLIPRVHERYGAEHSALVAAFATFQVRSAVRDLSKALGLPAGEVERLARSVDPWEDRNEISDDVDRVQPARARSPRWRALVQLAREAWGLPRHQTQHPGGMVIATQPLVDLCPVQPASMTDRQMVQWDKDSCADARFLKIDLLGLGMLSAVERCVDEIARVRDERIDLSRIAFGDDEVYARVQEADTMGVFQIESRAQMQMLKRTKPENLDDLTVQVALVRPGPIQGGAVHPYIERRKALRADPAYEVPYEHPALEPVLSDTLGAIVFQDQVIEVAMGLSGFSAGEAEGLRRAMSRRRSEAAIRAFGEKFVAGAMANGASRECGERVWGQIEGFSGFGFPKAHSAAFGLLAYQSTWLRVHYMPEFLCALLNEQPMGFYPPDTLVHEAQRKGLEVLPPCVVRSGAECAVEGAAVRVGLGYVNGVRAEEVKAMAEHGPYHSVEDLAARSGAGPETLGRLAWAGACDELLEGSPESRRRQALWLLGVAVPAYGAQLALPLEPHAAPELRALTAWERMLADYGSTGVTLREHPLELMRPSLGDEVVSSARLERLPDGAHVRVAGLVVARQRPATAHGMTFMLLEDEFGTLNLVVTPPVFDRCRTAIRAEPLVMADGVVENRDGTINIVVYRTWRLDRPDLPQAEIRHIEPRRAWSTEEDANNLRSVAPAAHSFGRRG